MWITIVKSSKVDIIFKKMVVMEIQIKIQIQTQKIKNLTLMLMINDLF